MNDNRQEVRGMRVSLSHESFANTNFDGCEVVFDGEPTELIEVRFNACSFTFVGRAANTLDFLRMLCAMDAEFAQQLGRELGILAWQTIESVAGLHPPPREPTEAGRFARRSYHASRPA